MNQYRRIVSYLYKYDNGKKGENTGFVRIDTREEGIRLHLRIRDLRMMNEKRLKMYFYFHREKKLQLIFVDEFLCARGNCEYKKMVFPDFTDRDFEKINGVVFLDEQGICYGSCWDEREISEELLPQEEKETEEETVSMQMSEMKPAVVKDSPLDRFPQLQLYDPEGAIAALRIRVEDIPMLSAKDWHLAENPFLKQAYESEPHLLLGKIRMPNGNDVWVLGAAGIYSNREKYLAGIFGFGDYIPVEQQEFKTGGRGYWIRQIEPVE